MALSLNQIFKPLNDFFINLYSSSADSGVMFRFDKFTVCLRPHPDSVRQTRRSHGRFNHSRY
jgi:hypothetical protein